MARPPDPAREIRRVLLATVPGPNFWSRGPVTRLDLAVGAYDEISSADVPGLTQALVEALPGLREHRCSIGQPGGFVTRLRRGTYAPHVVEHVALELQSAIGHDVGYGRARGGDRPGEYTVVFAHRHAGVGLCAAACALEVVRRAFAGRPPRVDAALADLRARARLPEPPRPERRVACAVTGGGDRAAVRREMACRGVPPEEVEAVAPAHVLARGLPFTRASAAVLLDAAPVDVAARYREPELAARLVATAAEAVDPGGVAVVPAGERALQERARDAGCRLAVFSVDGPVPAPDARLAAAAAWTHRGRVALDVGGRALDAGPLRAGAPAAPQLAAALAAWALAGAREEEEDGRDA